MVGAVCTGLAWRDGAKGNGMVGPTYRLCGAERGGILLVALVRRLLEEGEGPRELKRVRFYDGGHRSARLRWGRQHPAELPVRRSIRGERPARSRQRRAFLILSTRTDTRFNKPSMNHLRSYHQSQSTRALWLRICLK